MRDKTRARSQVPATARIAPSNNPKDAAFMRWMDDAFPATDMETRRAAFDNIREIKRIWLAGYNAAQTA